MVMVSVKTVDWFAIFILSCLLHSAVLIGCHAGMQAFVIRVVRFVVTDGSDK